VQAILIVEDSRTQADVLRLTLEGAGYRVDCAPDALAGWEQIQKHDFDLVISDILMPGMSGYELCRRIKQSAKAALPVLLLTSLSEPQDIIEGIACGADSFVTKPYQPEVLLGRIRSLFANQAGRGDPKVKVGLQVTFLGRTFTVHSGREQILDLLLATCEEIVRTNGALRQSQLELAAAKHQLEHMNSLLEARARLSEEKYHGLLEQANDAILLLDMTGRIIEVNCRAEALLGRGRHRLLGRPYTELLPGAEAEPTRAALEQLLSGRAVSADNVPLRRIDNRSVFVDLSASAVTVGAERIAVVIAHDASGRHQLEQQLRQAQKMEAIGRLAGGVAHDFNNLLTIINGYAELLRNRMAASEPGWPMLDEIVKAGQRAANLTRQLLSFSRQQVIAPRVVDVNAVLADMGQLVSRLIGEDVTLTILPEPGLGPVKADPGQLEQVVMNLVVNARDALPHGGRITIETRSVEFDAAYARKHGDVRPGPYVMLSVTDTGTGMTAEVKAQLFEPFFTTKANDKGTGLGLATVYGIVKQFGGHIEVYSEVGLGSTFKVYMPRQSQPLDALSVHRRSTILPRGHETLLLVEDEEAVRALARFVLRDCGYTVIEARHGEEALRLAEQHAHIDLLVTDVVMPKVSGADLARQLRDKRPGLRVLYLSGYTTDAVVHHGVLEQAAHFLQKPFTPAALAQKVREVLDRPADSSAGAAAKG
jgi:PAS domain S-box-containing protein